VKEISPDISETVTAGCGFSTAETIAEFEVLTAVVMKGSIF
jgi:hypothetical protein